MAAILIVDRDAGFREAVAEILTSAGHQVVTEGETFELVLLELRLPDGEGLELVRALADRIPAVVMVEGGGSPAVHEAVRLGAAEVVPKPLDGPQTLCRVVCNALAPAPVPPGVATPFVTEDPATLAILELARKVSPAEVPVLITGQSGCGKAQLARVIHEHSRRAAAPFITLDCAAPDLTLLDSAESGTLFLHEIGELDAEAQARVLGLEVDVRLIASTSRDLEREAAGGRFHPELHARLNLFSLAIPPLAERPSDVPRLARFFLARAADRLAKPEPALTTEAMGALLACAWPGNVRQLEDAMEHAASLCDAEVDAVDLPIEPASAHPVEWKDIERRAIEEALRTSGGNRARAARRLGISLRTLRVRLKHYGIGEQ
jgi:DNA-binding NtrC family response regulator